MRKGQIGNFKEWADSRYLKEKQQQQQQQQQGGGGGKESIITYDLKGNKIYPIQQQQGQGQGQQGGGQYDEITLAKLRILKAREENIALKRIIVQKNLEKNINPILSNNHNNNYNNNNYIQEEKIFTTPKILNSNNDNNSNNSNNNNIMNQDVNLIKSQSKSQLQSQSQSRQINQKNHSIISQDDHELSSQQSKPKLMTSSSSNLNSKSSIPKFDNIDIFETKEQTQQSQQTQQTQNNPQKNKNEQNLENLSKNHVNHQSNTNLVNHENIESHSQNIHENDNDNNINNDNNNNDTNNNNSKRKEKKKLKREKNQKQQSLIIQTISDMKRLSDHLNAAIDDNHKLLSGELTLYDSKGLSNDNNSMIEDKEKKKKQKMEEKQKRQKLKIQMDSLLRGQLLNILPLWRHRLRGNTNPKPEEILKGKSLFRVGFIMVLYFYVKPHLSIHNRKAQTKSSELDSLIKSILLFLDNTSHWIGKVVRVPISSIIQDNTLHFYHRKVERLPHNAQQQHGLIQLKVRLRYVIDSLTTSTFPPHIMNFLSSYISDGNYFKDGFLFDYETKILQFNKLGATRHMIQIPHEDTILKVLSQNKNLNDYYFFTYENTIYDISRPRLLIKDFLIIRVLIYNVILSPWHYGASAQPKDNFQQIIQNLTLFATIIYEICCHGEKDIPPIKKTTTTNHHNHHHNHNHHQNHQNQNHNLNNNNNNNNNNDNNNNNNQTEDEEKDKSDNTNTNTNTNINQNQNQKSNRPELLHLHSSDDNIIVNNPFVDGLIRLIDSIMGQTQNLLNKKQNNKNIIDNHKKTYESINNIHEYLLNNEVTQEIKNELKTTIEELSIKLNEWILNLTKELIMKKINDEKVLKIE